MARVTIVVSDDGADEQRLDEATRRLRRELADLDVAVEGAPGGPAPLGTRAVELAAIGTIIVTLSQSAVLAAVINAISAWLTQRRQGTVRVEMDGEALELTGEPTPQQRRLADAWLRRREAPEPAPSDSRDMRHTPVSGGDRDVRDKREAGVGRYALIVANYAYDDPGLRRLHAPAHDAERLARVLSDPAIGGFHVQKVINQSGPVVNEAVEDFFADRSADDLLLCYFSGHGVKDQDGELFFAAASTKLHRLGATAVAADFVNRRMTRSQSRRIVLILDCCYAGAFGRGMVARAGGTIAIEDQFGGRGRAVITASSAMEYAFEGQQLAETGGAGEPSVFTSALVAGLETGDADRDQDGFIGVDELYDYVYDRVRQATPHQTPGKWTFELQGDLYLARRSRPVTTPAQLQPELQEAIEHPFTGVRLGAVTELERLMGGRHAGTALAARLALERLTDDDSRKVSAAAAAVLGAAMPGVEPRPPDARTTSAAPEQASPASESAHTAQFARPSAPAPPSVAVNAPSASAPPAAPTSAPPPRAPTSAPPASGPAAVAASAPPQAATSPSPASGSAANAPRAPGPVHAAESAQLAAPPSDPVRASSAPAAASAPSSARLLGGRQLPVQILAASGGVLLVLGFGMRLGDPGVRTSMSDYLGSATLWLWALVGAALVFTIVAPYKRERDVAQGAAIGLAAGILGLLCGIVSYRSYQTSVEAGFYFAAGGAVLALAAVTLETLPRPRGIMPIATVVSATLAVVAVAVTVVVPDAVPVFLQKGDHIAWGVLLFVAWATLAVVAVLAGVLRWLTTPSRLATGLGELSDALVIAAISWTLIQDASKAERVAYSIVLVAAVLVVALIGDDRPVLLLSARLSVIAMLLMQVPSGPVAHLSDAAGRGALVAVAAAAAVGAFFIVRGRSGKIGVG